MAIDIEVYPYLSPRLVEILLPSTDVSVQEIYDAIRNWEDSEEGMCYKPLIDAAGKEDLGGSVTVGITATLQNAQAFFTGRTTPLDDGVGRTCDATDSTGTNLYVDDADFVSDGVYVGAVVYNQNTGETATVTAVVDAHNLTTFPLSGAGGQGWTSGDEYAVHPMVLCSITGGNLVAVDDVGDPIDAAFPSPGVYLRTTSSSSATIADLHEIVELAWDTVHIDTIVGTSGTEFPIGTASTPVDNLTDAKAIAIANNIEIFKVRGSITLDSTFDRYTFLGYASNTSAVDLNGKSAINSAFISMLVSGQCNGSIRCQSCRLSAVTDLEGVFMDCSFTGDFSVKSAAKAYAFRAFSWDLAPMTMDMNGDGIFIYYGTAWWTVANLTSAGGLAAFSGDIGVTVDPTMTDGNVFITGATVLDADNKTGGNVITTYKDSFKVLEERLADHAVAGTLGAAIEFVKQIEGGRWRIVNNQMIFYKSDNVTEVARFNLKDGSGSPAEEDVKERQRA
jgi:hypothetical protein